MTAPRLAPSGTNPYNWPRMNTESGMDVAATIDSLNREFIDNAKARLRDLEKFSTEALEWLMVEHYQFSSANVEFLSTAAKTTRSFDTDSVERELIRNCKEESGHAAMYRRALMEIDIDVETRVEFHPTTNFLGSIGELLTNDPSNVLGTMFATETAAIFEHEVFLDISNEVIARRGMGERGSALVYFHEMHLSGVEQSHRDELGVFIRGVSPDEELAVRQGERPTLRPRQALEGASLAIAAMKSWWSELLTKTEAITASA